MHPTGGSRPLFAMLDETRRRLRRAAVLEAGTLLLAGFTLIVLLATLGAAAGLPAPILAGFEVAILLALFTYGLVRYGVLLSRAVRERDAVATWLDRALDVDHPRSLEKNTTILPFRSAVELSRDRGRYGESEALIDAALDDADARSRKVDPAAVVSRSVRPRLNRKLTAFAGGTFAAAALWFVMPEHFGAAVGALAALEKIDDALAPPPQQPRLGDIRLTYRYPAYANRPTHTVESTDGAIRALPGTEILIETQERRVLADATLIVSYGDGQESDGDGTRTAVEVEGRRMKATFVVTRGGTYRFRVRTPDGEVLEERRGHPIELELDAPPDVAMLEPKDSPIEVNEHDRVDIEFRAEDDFGLGDVGVAWRVLGSAREGHQVLSSAGRGKRLVKGRGQFDLSKLDLKPGDRIAYSVEARDNDTVSGPKVGASMTRELRVYSKDAHHREVIAMQEKALDELVHILGDNLEGPFRFDADSQLYEGILTTSEKIVERARAAAKLLRETADAVAKDPLGRKEVAKAFNAARNDLVNDTHGKAVALARARETYTREVKGGEKRTIKTIPEDETTTGSARRVERAQKKMIGRLERNAVYLADLLKDQRMIDAEQLAKQLREEQQKLREALEQYKNAPDEQKRRLLADAIRDIRERIAEITSELAKLQQSIPADFANMDAMESMDSMEQMDRVQKLIEAGDLEAAMKELEQMLQQTESMLSELQNGRQELNRREYSEVTEKAREMMKLLEEIEKNQRDLAARTSERAQDLLERMKQRLGKIDQFLDKQRRRLEQVKKALEKAEPGAHLNEGDLYDQTMRRVEDTSRALEAKDFGAALEMAEQAMRMMSQLEQDALRRAEQARRFGELLGNAIEAERAGQTIREARPQMEKVYEDIKALMPSPSEMLSQEERQGLGKMSGEQEGLRGQTRRLSEQLKQLGEMLPQLGNDPGQALGEAQQAMGGASQGLQGGDSPGALGEQRRALDLLNRFREELNQMGGKGQGGAGVPLPFGGQQGNMPGGEEGMSGDPRSLEKVEIPKPDQYRAPAEFREEILEAAKQGTVEAYREAVRKYYEEIVK